jgi:LysM repeat protein
MSRAILACLALLLTAAAEAPPLPHASGLPAGPGPGCGGGFTAARGDTLYSIARRCETTVTELAQENGLGQPPLLAAGQRLGIPGFDRAEAPKPPEARPADRPHPRMPAPPPMPPRVRPDRPPPPPREARTVYRFQAGDTLYSLARWAGTSLLALLAANPGIDPRDIDAGTAIRLPRGAVRPEPMRLSERGRPAPASMSSAVSAPPRSSMLPPPPRADGADKPKPDDEDDGPTPGGMDDGRPAPDGM